MGQVSPQQAADYFFPKLNDCTSCPRSKRREEVVISRLHTGHSYVTYAFLLKERSHLCAFHLTSCLSYNIFCFFAGFIEARESHFTARSLHFLIFIFLDDIALDCLFNCLKEINIFGKIKKFQFSFGFVFILSTLFPPLPSPPLNFLFVLMYQF